MGSRPSEEWLAMKKINRLRTPERGFTLMEVMISLGIFAVVLASSLYAFHTSHQLSTLSRERLLALTAARSYIEAIKNTPLSAVDNISTTSFAPTELVNGVITMLTPVTFPAGAPLATADYATITVRVTWNGYNNIPQRLEITTIRSKY